MFTPLPPDPQFARSDVTRIHCHPTGTPDAEAGLALLIEAAQDVPVALVRLEGGMPVRSIREQPVPPAELRLAALVPHVTAYVAAYRTGDEDVLLIVARSPLVAPLPDGSNLPAALREGARPRILPWPEGRP